MKTKNLAKKGFTLVELVIVIVVISILIALSTIKFIGIQKDASVASLYRNMDSLEKSISVYFNDNDSYPIKKQPVDYSSFSSELLSTIGSLGDDPTQLYEVDLNADSKYISQLQYGYKKTSQNDYFVYSTKNNRVYYVNGLENSKSKYIFTLNYETTDYLKNVAIGSTKLLQNKIVTLPDTAATTINTLSADIYENSTVNVTINGKDVSNAVIYSNSFTAFKKDNNIGLEKIVYAGNRSFKTFSIGLDFKYGENNTIEIKVPDKNISVGYTVFVPTPKRAIWHGVSSNVYDGDTNTSFIINRSTSESNKYLTWDGYLDNMPVTLTAHSITCNYMPGIANIQILDINDRPLYFYDINNNYVNNLVFDKATVSKTFRMPVGAAKIYCKNVVANVYASEDSHFELVEITDYEDKIPPASVSNITGTATTSSVTLNWVNPTDSDFSKVAIYRNAQFVAFVPKGTTTYKDTPLSQTTDYTYTLEAWDNTGNKSGSVTYNISTLTPEVVFSGVGASAVDDNLTTGITVAWNAPATVKWNKDITGRTLNITACTDAPGFCTWRIGYAYVYDSTGKLLTSAQFPINTPTTRSIIMPSGANKIVLTGCTVQSEAANLTLYNISVH